MSKLIIVESPAKIKTISKILGKDFKIMSTVGHVKDLPSKELGVSFDKGVKIDYVTLEGKEKTLSDIRKEAKKSDEIFLAPDPDREGEIIAWHVEQDLKAILKDKSKIYRIAFNEITKPAIEEAISNPYSVDMNKVAAQQARRVLDRLVGYEVSPILWKKIAKGLSAGRVQSVTLKLIVQREKELKEFKAEEYWSIEAEFSFESGRFLATLFQIKKEKINITNEADAQKAVGDLKKQSYSVDSIKDSKRKKNPAAPFMTSTLQQSAYNQLGFAVQRTMQTAQNLYEGIPLDDPSKPVALITYMRTDSMRISDVAIKQVREFIKKEYGNDYLPAKSNVYVKGKAAAKAQDAHEAIRPIDVSVTPDSVRRFLSPDAAKLYELIWKRFVACQLKPAEYSQRQVIVKGGDYTFKVTGSTLLFDGYLKVYNDDSATEEEKLNELTSIPKDLKEKMPVDIEKVSPKQHFTQPPPRYTEASLVKELEKEGIGRPSTYATILRTIQARLYTELDDKKRFVPTELGIVVTKMLNENLPHIMDVKFTASMEEKLDKVANGELERDKLLKNFYTDFEKDLEAFRGEDVKKATEKTDIECPKCHEGHLIIRFGKAGPFAGCSNFPECGFTSNFERQDDGTIKLKTETPQVLEEQCPKCGKNLRQMVGRYGPFVSCSGYPECKYIQSVKAGFKCPFCKKGDVVQKNWKGKKFWGCGNYPECKFSVSGDIEETPCPKCKWPFLQTRTDKMGITTLNCANKECDYRGTKESE